MGEEFLVLFLVEFPVGIVKFGVVELVFYLLPYVVEDVFALLSRLVLEVGAVGDGFSLATVIC